MVLTRVSLYLVGPAAVWLKTLHDIVRDDRYLVGMRLQDRVDKVSEGTDHMKDGICGVRPNWFDTILFVLWFRTVPAPEFFFLFFQERRILCCSVNV